MRPLVHMKRHKLSDNFLSVWSISNFDININIRIVFFERFCDKNFLLQKRALFSRIDEIEMS